MRWLVNLWIVLSLAVAMAQIVLGTDLAFVLVSLVMFLLAPVVFRALLDAQSIGAFVFAATFAKLFFVSQVVKVALLQPADSHLQAPLLTVTALLVLMVVFLLAVPVLRTVPIGRSGIVPIPQDPAFLTRLTAVALSLTLLSLLLRHLLGYDRVGDSDYVEGRGLVVIFFLGQLAPLAVAALAARAAILSGGQRFLDRWVLLTIGACVLQGVWENQRTSMLAGAVAYGIVYLSYGGRIRIRQIAALVVAGAVMQVVVFPLIDVQRGFQRDLGAIGFLSETLSVAWDLLDPTARDTHVDRLDAMYEDWDTRLYYGSPTGFLDRFSPNAIDETVAHTEAFGPIGLSELPGQFLYMVPNMLLQSFGIERPMRSGELLETSILGTFTNMNYGVPAEIYAHSGLALFLPASLFVLCLYLLGLRLVYGPAQRNYFSAFGFSTCFFTYAVSDMSDIFSQLSIQGGLNLLVMLLAQALHGIASKSGAGSPRPGAADGTAKALGGAPL
ncbi:MAG TPA: hypothetical protein VEB20_02500 [Azospirillaceae bacterium]|nr:hypothetical protein [Azospirillaceae bacterium]